MPPHNVVEPFRRAGFAQQIVAALFAFGPVLPPDSSHFAHSRQTRPLMRFLQPIHIGTDAGNAGFNAPVSLADLDILGQRRGRVVQKQLYIIPQRGLIAFQSQGIVAALLNHLLRHLTLAMHSVSGNYFAAQSQHFQQLGQRCNFVGFVIHSQLPQYQALFLGPGADQMQRGELLGAVVRTAPGFPVHRQYARAAFGELPHKTDEPLLESGGVQHTQQPGEGIVAGDAVVQFQEGLEEFPFGVAEKFHVGAGLAAAEHSAKGNDQDVVAGMAAGVAWRGGLPGR